MQQIMPSPDRIGPIEAATAPPPAIEGWTGVAEPGDIFRHPRDVLAHPGLSAQEKRAVLAAWASDVHAVEAAPALRRLPGRLAVTVSVDDVLSALRALDGAARRERAPLRPPVARRQRLRSVPARMPDWTARFEMRLDALLRDYAQLPEAPGTEPPRRAASRDAERPPVP
ncbi:hypothetical protein [Methylobacterium oryzisoli]|uniref:hypothetical protein n=1 Tax=Methylobacterium oryzisoli TaxID=3385502 RepID=UPI003892AA17